MKKKKVKNPLVKRIVRELRGDWRKYLVVGLFLILTIGFVSGMYVANESMMKAADEGISKYKLEDGHFELDHKADADLLEKIPARVYENFYRNEEEDYNNDGAVDGTIRIFKETKDVNLACLMDGRFPDAEDEIAIDRMHADNVGVEVGDRITVSGKPFKVVGLLA